MNEVRCDIRTYSMENDVHQHDYMQMIMPIDGRLSLTTKSVERDVDVNSIAFVGQEDLHEFKATSHNAFVVVDIPHHIQYFQSRKTSKLIRIDQDNKWHALRSLFYEEAKRKEHTALLPLVDYAMILMGNENEAKSCKFMKENLSLPLSVKMLADLEGYSESYYATWFMNKFGVSPMKYLLNMRMDQAKKLLVTTDESVLMIGLSLGYEHIASFTRAFKRLEGVSPLQYRKGHRNG